VKPPRQLFDECNGALGEHVTAEYQRSRSRPPKHLGARIGIIAVVHTWDSALTHKGLTVSAFPLSVPVWPFPVG
jgi:hypothetical protein